MKSPALGCDDAPDLNEDFQAATESGAECFNYGWGVGLAHFRSQGLIFESALRIPLTMTTLSTLGPPGNEPSRYPLHLKDALSLFQKYIAAVTIESTFLKESLSNPLLSPVMGKNPFLLISAKGTDSSLDSCRVFYSMFVRRGDKCDTSFPVDGHEAACYALDEYYNVLPSGKGVCYHLITDSTTVLKEIPADKATVTFHTAFVKAHNPIEPEQSWANGVDAYVNAQIAITRSSALVSTLSSGFTAYMWGAMLARDLEHRSDGRGWYNPVGFESTPRGFLTLDKGLSVLAPVKTHQWHTLWGASCSEWEVGDRKL